MNSERNSTLRRIAHSTSILAFTTAISRVLGFIRDILIAHLFGTAAQAQAFVVAFRLPNLMRDLVAEGAVSSAFVPVLSYYRTKAKPEEFWRLSQALLQRLLFVLCLIGIAGWFYAEVLVRIMAPGFVQEPEKFMLTVKLTRILFPLIVLVGLWAYFMGLLNSLQHFAMPSLAPAVMNVAMIAACLWGVPYAHPEILALAFGVIIGGLLQVVIQLPTASRLGFRWQWQWHWHHEGSSRVLKLLGPRLLGSAVHQTSVFVHTALASLGAIVGDGAVAVLYFANRLVQLPLALFGTASAQASLPALSEQAAHNDLVAFRKTLQTVIRMMTFVMVPSSVGLMVLATPIVEGLFERGAFDHRATLMTSQALIGYSLGLLAYSISKILSGAFYALQDTWTPVRLAVEAVVVNVLLSVTLMVPLQVGGLALAAALSNILNAYRLIRALEKRLKVTLLTPLVWPFLKILCASLFMGLCSWICWNLGPWEKWFWLGIPLVVGASLIGYAGACWFLQVPELSSSLRWLRTFRRSP